MKHNTSQEHKSEMQSFYLKDDQHSSENSAKISDLKNKFLNESFTNQSLEVFTNADEQSFDVN